MVARLVDMPDATSVKIERKDDGLLFTVPVSTFSFADQDYVSTHQAQFSRKQTRQSQDEEPVAGAADHLADGSLLKAPDSSAWTLLNSAGHQPASTYANTTLELIIGGINQRTVVRGIKAPSGVPLTIRTDPLDLASRIRITGDMPRMPLDTFVREIGRANNLGIMIDSEGMVVLVEKRRPKSANEISFLGVPVETR